MHDREVGHVAAWNGTAGTIARAANARGGAAVLPFAAAHVIEGEPAVGLRATFTPSQRAGGACAVAVRVKPC